jgi:CO dehydrogenase/acetyl-CoA synthase alpha subunit
VAEVQTYLDSLRENNSLVATGLGALQALNIDLGPATDAFDELTATVEGLSGDTVGDAAETINASLTQITDAYASVRTTAECE